MRWILVLLILGGTAGAAWGQTSLYWALANNDALEVWRLAPDEVPETFEENGLTAPEWVVERGNAEAMDALIWRGVALNRIDDKGRNLLFEAAELGRLDLFEKIMAQGALVDRVDDLGLTLVHAAAASPHPEMLHMLLVKGLGPVEKTVLGVTPLMLACAAGRSQEVAMLLEWGAVPEDSDYLGRSVHDYAVLGGDAKTLALIEASIGPWSIEPDDEAPLP